MLTDDRYKQALEKSADTKTDIERLYETPTQALARSTERMGALDRSFDTAEAHLRALGDVIARGHALLARTNRWIAASKKAARGRT